MGMKIIISPAKKMRADPDSLAWQALPEFLPQAEQLVNLLRQMTPPQLQQLWKCSDAIAAENIRRLERMDLRAQLTPAILAYEGIQYQYMAPGVFTDDQLAYLQAHLRILSGLYGLLRPLDGVRPYRLEMQARLAGEGFRDLYAFWGGRIAESLCRETDCIVNLASREYSLCVCRHLPAHVRLVTCVFAEEKAGRLVEKGTLCKMARGEMVRYMTENGIESPGQLQSFDRLGFRFAPQFSSPEKLVFVRQPEAS